MLLRYVCWNQSFPFCRGLVRLSALVCLCISFFALSGCFNAELQVGCVGDTSFCSDPRSSPSSTPNPSVPLPVETTGATVVSVGSADPDGWVTGGSVAIDVAFSKPVTVSGGNPSLMLETGTVDRAAVYSSGSGGTVLRFTYAVGDGDATNDLDYVSAGALALEGGSIVDGEGKPANLALPAPGAAGSLAHAKAIGVDTVPPTWSNSITHAATDSSLTSSPGVTYLDDATDGGSGILKYQYAIGTGTTGTAQSDIKAWTDVSGGSFVAGALALNKRAPFHVSMRVVDQAGLTATFSSSGWTVPLSVEPAYATNGADWNDYVLNDGSSAFASSGGACTGSELGNPLCLHAGELRKVVVSGVSSCAGLALSDSLGAFDWTCRDGSGTATFFSSGLKSTKGLKDLLNPTSWKSNSVTLAGSGNNMSVPASWWGNPVAALPDNSAGSVIKLDLLDDDGAGPDQAYGAKTILTLSSSALTRGYNLNADKFGIVIFAGQTLSYNGNAGTNCKYSTGETATPDSICVIAAGDQKHLWIEGQTDAFTSGTRATQSLAFGKSSTGVRFSRIHQYASREGNGDEIALTGATSNLFTQVTLESNQIDGLWVDTTSRYNTFSDLTTRFQSSKGVYVGTACTNNVFDRVRAFGNGGPGFIINAGDANNNFIRGLYSVNNGGDGFKAFSDNNVITGVVLANNGGIGLNFDAAVNNSVSGAIVVGNASHGLNQTNISKYNTFTRVLAAHNGLSGMWNMASSAYGIFHHAAFVNNTNKGLSLSSSSNFSASQLVAAHNGQDGVFLSTSSNNKFTGNLLAGNNTASACLVSGGTNPGLVTSSCANQGASTANFVALGGLAASFVAKITADDSANGSDANGAASYAASLDWSTFENEFRIWGKDGSAFPASDNRGRCSTGICRIWDFSLAAGDSLLRGNSGNGATANGGFPASAGDACPAEVDGTQFVESGSYTYDVAYTTGFNGDDVGGNGDGDCDSGETCLQRYLKNAIETPGDGAGDDDGLCESGETCVYAPNFGAYQGHGTLSGCAFSQNGGAISGVTISGYLTNGR